MGITGLKANQPGGMFNLPGGMKSTIGDAPTTADVARSVSS